MAEVTQDITDLPSGGRDIYYRLMADNGDKPGFGEIETFKTMATKINRKHLHEHTTDVVKRARQGESFTVTVDGAPAATLGPIQPTLLKRLTSRLRR